MSEHQQTQQSRESKPNFQKQATFPSQIPVSHPASIIQHARINPKSLTAADVLQLQRTIGNRAVGRLLSDIRNPSKVQQVPIQRQEIPEEEEPLQGKFESNPEKEICPSCMQMQEIPEEEEPLQGKFETIQRLEPEDEEKLQMKSVMQRQEIPEEEKPIQGKMIRTVQRQEIPEEEPLQTKSENNTGMPDNLKAGVENLSGIDMSDVRVHYNSSKPAEVGALAYTQGTNIHVAPGQERHLPHEAWHVVQQAQGRVKPTLQLKNVVVNDDAVLEREADIMGGEANQLKKGESIQCHLQSSIERNVYEVGSGRLKSKEEQSDNLIYEKYRKVYLVKGKVLQRMKFDSEGVPISDDKAYTYDTETQPLSTFENLTLDKPTVIVGMMESLKQKTDLTDKESKVFNALKTLFSKITESDQRTASQGQKVGRASITDEKLPTESIPSEEGSDFPEGLTEGEWVHATASIGEILSTSTLFASRAAIKTLSSEAKPYLSKSQELHFFMSPRSKPEGALSRFPKSYFDYRKKDDKGKKFEDMSLFSKLRNGEPILGALVLSISKEFLTAEWEKKHISLRGSYPVYMPDIGKEEVCLSDLPLTSIALDKLEDLFSLVFILNLQGKKLSDHKGLRKVSFQIPDQSSLGQGREMTKEEIDKKGLEIVSEGTNKIELDIKIIENFADRYIDPKAMEEYKQIITERVKSKHFGVVIQAHDAFVKLASEHFGIEELGLSIEDVELISIVGCE